ncbi:hypothetical protein TIFTF001_056006 [Ficus carica]|uniref:Secreted protein n=1 Tax=Ficus carica TaxID=3494 RepID=A0AA88EFN7_FICCA|nr:hypothetical protein TIFTF001_056006 [Ficus carica]
MHWCEGARLVFWSAIRLTRVDGALQQDGETQAPIKPSVNGVWSALLGSDIRGALGTRGGSDQASRLVVWVRIDGYFRFHVTRARSEVVFYGWCRSRHQHKPPSISGLTWPGMLRVLVWSFAARHLFLSSGCSRLFEYGRVSTV